MSRLRAYSKNEERANSYSHGLGVLLGLIAAPFLLHKAYLSANVWAVVSVIVYLVGMLSSYIASTIYHGTQNERRKRGLQQIDHAAIYLHIAGTYTPFTLITLRQEGMWGWGLFTFVWLSALIGFYVSFKKSGKHSHIETLCYIIMGCSIVVAIEPLFIVLSVTNKLEALYWLIGGGGAYIVGALFYSLAKVKYMHTIFHLFVLLGSLCHIVAISIIL